VSKVSTRLRSLQVLSVIVRKQSHRLHEIAQTPLFETIVHILKV
jgi:hypothetical protein